MSSDRIIMDDLEYKIMAVFIRLPLPDKLLVYARYKYETDFKVVNNDLFGMSRRKACDRVSAFLKAVREA
jgi:hypothetical protein